MFDLDTAIFSRNRMVTAVEAIVKRCAEFVKEYAVDLDSQAT